MSDARLTRREALGGAAAGGAALAALRLGAPATGTARSATSLSALARRLKGTLVLPGERAYPAAARIWNVRFSIPPRAIAFCETPQDVAEVICFARERDWPIAARSGRHSFEGYCNTRGGIVCDVSRMRGVKVDRGRGTVTLGAGGDNLSAYKGLILQNRISLPTGSCPTVGLGGLTLGGGLSRMTRRHGMLVDDLVEAEVVLPDGRRVRTNERREPDLFWALRGGGGGNFGVATSFTYRYHGTPAVTNIGIAYPWAQGGPVLETYQRMIDDMPRELGSFTFRATKTPQPTGPDVLAIDVGGLFYGSPADATDLMAPLLALNPSATGIQTVSFASAWTPDDCSVTGQKVRCTVDLYPNYQRSDFFDEPVPAAGIASILDFTERWPGGPGGHEGGVQIEALGRPSASNAVSPSATAFVHRRSLHHMVYLNFWGAQDTPRVARENIRWVRDFYAAMRPYASGFAYQNYIDRELKTWREAYYGRNWARLRRVKRRYDPDWVFRFAQGIEPAR